MLGDALFFEDDPGDQFRSSRSEGSKRSSPAHSDAWQHYSVSTRQDGSFLVLVKTNDDNDDGQDDGRVVEWEEEFASLEAALKFTGRSRVGVSGVRVIVTVDGERV